MSKLKGKSAWSIADNFSQQAISFVIFAVLARWLTPQEFGLLAIAHLIVQLVRFTILDAIAMPVVRGKDAGDEGFNWLFTLCTVVSLVIAMLMALSSPLLARFFSAPSLVPVLFGMSLVVVLFGLVRAHEARLLREGNFRLLAIRSICSVCAGGAVAVYMAYRGAGAMALVAQQLTTGIVALLIALAAEWRTWRPHWVWSNRLIRVHAKEIGGVGTSALLNYANNNGDTALVSLLIGPYATGLYNLAKRVLSAAFLIIAVSLGRVSVTLFVQQQSDPDALRRSYARILGTTLLLLAPVYSISTALATPLVTIVFGPQWLPSVPLFGWMAVAYLCQAAFSLGQNLSFATGHAARVPKFALAQLLLALSVALVLSQWMDVTGVAAGFAIGSIVGMLAMQLSVKRQLELPFFSFVLATLPALIGSIFGVAIVLGLPFTGLTVTGWISLVSTGVAGLIAYGGSAELTRLLLKLRK